MTTTFESKRASGNGTGQFNLQPPPGRRARLPEFVVGAALVVGFSLAAVLWHMGTTDKDPALALAAPVARGEMVEASDLRVVYVASDDPIARLGRSDAESIVGRVALADLPAGTILTPGSVAPRLSVGPGEGLVGLALDPGQVPATRLLPGELVNIVAGPAEGAAVPADGRLTAVLASRATVFAVEELRTEGRKLVSVKLPEADANRVAAAAERGPVRLVLVGR